ncbi:type 4a pilus biogenesis protein PilO [Dactylosporangium sp. NBC_01737]|uniref:type 4a pilus biogenesis protein PilO n=1 Tax=Dactylosporangium sp. NBC_01737 TaxID=2975959 RepID=UPI002E0F3E7C|nr:type 4a pilus biogenesis protein PilO [Dactylosporangium sp. NBC_01737]
MRPERLWLLGGALTAIVLLAFSYYFVIAPRYQEAEDLKALADDTTVEVAKLRSQIADLDTQNKRIEEYRTQLTAELAALPETDSVAALLREVQTAGELSGITVSGITVGSAAEVDAGGPLTVHALPISLTAAGPSAKLNPFLDQLQKTQPRALLINSMNVAATTGDRTTMTLTVQAFYATGK